MVKVASTIWENWAYKSTFWFINTDLNHSVDFFCEHPKATDEAKNTPRPSDSNIGGPSWARGDATDAGTLLK